MVESGEDGVRTQVFPAFLSRQKWKIMDPQTATAIRRLFDIDQDDKIQLPDSLVEMWTDFRSMTRKIAPGANRGEIIAMLVTLWKVTHKDEHRKFIKARDLQHQGLTGPQVAAEVSGDWRKEYEDYEKGHPLTVEWNGKISAGTFHSLPQGSRDIKQQMLYVKVADDVEEKEYRKVQRSKVTMGEMAPV